jgi:hypothetical protein
MSLLHVSDTPLPGVNRHLPLGKGTVDFAGYINAICGRLTGWGAEPMACRAIL